MSTSDNMLDSLRASVPERMQYLLIALGFVLAVFGLLELTDTKDSLLTEKQALSAEIQSLAEGSISDWEERVALASEARAAWTETRWQAETPGIASANVQKYLTELTREVGLESVRLTVASDPVTTDNNELLRFEIAGIGASNILAELLVSLSVSPKVLLVTDISAQIRTDQKTRVSVAGYVPYFQSLPAEEVTE